MDPDALKDTSVRLAWLADRLDARSERATQMLENAATGAHASVQRLDGAGAQIADDVARALSAQLASTLRQATDAAMADARQALAAHAAQIQALDRALLQSRMALLRQYARWWQFGPAVALAACVLAVVGITAWAAQVRGEVARLQLQADALRAYNAADVTLCDGALCARLEPGGRYQRIAPRPAR